jgi:hypothetical protein
LLFIPVNRTISGMTIFEAIDKALAARGWRYDGDEEQFM